MTTYRLDITLSISSNISITYGLIAVAFWWFCNAEYISKDVLLITHDFHKTCHFVTFYFVEEKTPNDAVRPQHQSQFTPKMKANAVPHLLSSLVWIDQYNECNGMTSFVEFMQQRGQHPDKCLPWPTSHIIEHIQQGECAQLRSKLILDKSPVADRSNFTYIINKCCQGNQTFS